MRDTKMKQISTPTALLVAAMLTAETSSAADSKPPVPVQTEVTEATGFETTKICGRDVLRLATERAEQTKVDLRLFRAPSIRLVRTEGKMKWYVSWSAKEALPGAFFTVVIDDETGSTEFLRGS